MIDSLLLLPQEAKRVSLFQKALFTRYLHLRASKGFYDAKIFTLQYKIFFPEFDEFNSTLGLLFFLKNLLRSQKNRSLKLSKQQIGCLQMFLHNGFTKHVAFKICSFC
jgi:hypothetical protein